MGRFLAAIVALVLVAHFASAQAGDAVPRTLSTAAFTDAVAQALKGALPDGSTVTVQGDRRLAVRYPNNGTVDLDLGNAYARYVRAPESLQAVIADNVAALSQIPTWSATLDRSRVVPVIKTKQWPEVLRRAAQANGPAAEYLIEPLNSELVVAYAEDTPSAIRFLTTRDDVGDRAALRGLALANLRRLLPKIAIAGADGVFMVAAGGNYEASLLLADEVWSGGQIKVDGDIVIAVCALCHRLAERRGRRALAPSGGEDRHRSLWADIGAVRLS
jgi:hypothetical protein